MSAFGIELMTVSIEFKTIELTMKFTTLDGVASDICLFSQLYEITVK